jgi:methionyl-tRNA formyltransferase
MKIVFFGTSDRSIPVLEALKKNFELVLCVTKTDTRIGRHQELKESGVKRWASRNGVYFLEISGFRGDETERISKEIIEQKIELAVVCDFSFIIPYKLVETLKGKFTNIHFSLLPMYRGASPVQFSLLNYDKRTGITFHLVDKGMDDGAIIAQYEYIIPDNITSGELFAELFKLAAEKLPSVVSDYTTGQITPLLQDISKATYTYFPTHPKSTFIYKEDARIDWSKSPEVIEREIRAFNPWPISWGRVGELEQNATLLQCNLELRTSLDKSLIMKIYSAELKNGKLKIKEIQVEGKKKMNWDTFKNGYIAAV